MNGEIISLHQEINNDEAARELSERVMRQRQLDLEADQLEAIALNKESLNEINEAKKLSDEAKKRKAMSYLIECSFKNSKIGNFGNLQSDQNPRQNSFRQ